MVFVELPEVGKAFKKGEEAAVVESVKAASEVYAPGEIVAVNGALEKAPGDVNEDQPAKAGSSGSGSPAPPNSTR